MARFRVLTEDNAVSDVADPGTALGAALGAAYVAFGTTEPTPPSGVEVVWFKTDGAGHVVDILSGVGA